MADREQIEEMAHIMCEYYNKGFCANGDITEICEDMPDCCYKNDAEALYDAGYRKVFSGRDDFVSLLNEEIKELSIIEKTRKETAREILNLIIDEGNVNPLTSSYMLPFKIFNKIKREYGVEVEEQ